MSDSPRIISDPNRCNYCTREHDGPEGFLPSKKYPNVTVKEFECRHCGWWNVKYPVPKRKLPGRSQ